jgi:hypothetical protein
VVRRDRLGLIDLARRFQQLTLVSPFGEASAPRAITRIEQPRITRMPKSSPTVAWWQSRDDAAPLVIPRRCGFSPGQCAIHRSG